ncbi:MAG TPA: zinc ribbon domain-containing protein [Mycobacterium sp.]|nr:zinc ribbon domain-containing protein [Mycobacterium sp.]
MSERTDACRSCGLVIDRDLNAAVNLARHTQRETDPNTASSRVAPAARPQ